MTRTPRAPELKRALGFRDLLLFYIVTVFSVRWVATAAAAGPSALVIWAIAAAGLFVPLVFTVIELSSRFPDEGGLYVWTKQAFGPFAGFMTGWMYWTANLPYLPGLLYLAAANVLFVGGAEWQSLSNNSTYFLVASSGGLLVAVSMNVVGLDVAKWLSRVGGVVGWMSALVLVVLGLFSWIRHGSTLPLTAASFIPGTSLKEVVLWSTMAFAFAGLEGASIMGEEIENPRRAVPRAVVAAAVIIAALYMTATLAVLVAVPVEQVSGLQGIMQAVQAMAARAGAAWLVPLVAALVTLNVLGGVGGWFAATARLPFVAGIDRFLPRAFGRVHPRWGTPHVALLVQAAIAAAFVFLGQAGTSVRGAYDGLVSMSIVTYFLPYLVMFAAMIKLQRTPAGPGVIRVPGGPTVATALAGIGFFTTVVSIVLACVPPNDELNKTLAVVKVVGASLVLVVVGVGVYAVGRRQAIDGAAG